MEGYLKEIQNLKNEVERVDKEKLELKKQLDEEKRKTSDNQKRETNEDKKSISTHQTTIEQELAKKENWVDKPDLKKMDESFKQLVQDVNAVKVRNDQLQKQNDEEQKRNLQLNESLKKSK